MKHFHLQFFFATDCTDVHGPSGKINGHPDASGHKLLFAPAACCQNLWPFNPMQRFLIAIRENRWLSDLCNPWQKDLGKGQTKGEKKTSEYVVALKRHVKTYSWVHEIESFHRNMSKREKRMS